MPRLILFVIVSCLSYACSTQEENKEEESSVSTAISYQPTEASISQHPLPGWYQDAKLGIFIHWGLYSVPGWAKGTTKPLEEILANTAGEEWFANNPYAEWYLNSLRIEGSSTEKHHHETYGENFSYYDFVPQFNEEIKQWNPEEWAQLFKNVGAEYVVLTTKHHDGFLLWPSNIPNPYKENYYASRDLVGELSKAVTEQGMKMGLYYSSGLDWTFNDHVIKNFPDLFQAVPQQEEYAEYIDAHWRELMERYNPWILWADIGSPQVFDAKAVIADFYNKNPEGVVNNRHKFQLPTDTTPALHHDFTTPEYQVLDSIAEKKWETCRGIGLSFGYNQTEDVSEFLSVDELVDSFVDIVSKNGNLLLNVGPKADGTIPEGQRVRLEGLGEWLETNGEAIFGSRPWTQAEATTTEGGRVRFTQKEDAIYMIILDEPEGNSITISDISLPKINALSALQNNRDITYQLEDGNLTIELPEAWGELPAYTFRLSTNEATS
ncbi:alpha-L-fucosidase [Catalinimonas sp. 4WD22]|uniref:alpha-L-fucosidase n=1 Tax=Catalinimonas locisalis TaxID=3133978 RepID=UPI003101150D